MIQKHSSNYLIVRVLEPSSFINFISLINISKILFYFISGLDLLFHSHIIAVRRFINIVILARAILTRKKN
jgi:hypothetical protein